MEASPVARARSSRPFVAVLTLDESFVKLSADYPVAVAHLRISRPVPMHGHRFHELSVIKAGRATHVARGLEFPVAPGMVVLAEAGATHGYIDVDQLEKRNLYFSTDWLAAEFWPESLIAETTTDGFTDLIDLEALVLEPSASAVATIDGELDDIERELDKASHPRHCCARACSKYWFTLAAPFRTVSRTASFARAQNYGPPCA